MYTGKHLAVNMDGGDQIMATNDSSVAGWYSCIFSVIFSVIFSTCCYNVQFFSQSSVAMPSLSLFYCLL